MAETAIMNFFLDIAQWLMNALQGSVTTNFVNVPTNWLPQAEGYMGWVGLVVNLPAVEAAFAFYAAYYMFVFGIATLIWVWKVWQ